jgi:hypothetical protein
VSGAEIGFDLAKRNPAGPNLRALEVLRDQVGTQAHCLEDLCALITLDGGDAHLRHRLQQSVIECVPVRIDSSLLLGTVRARHHVCDGLVRQIRVDRTGTVSHQRGEMVYLTRVTRLHDESNVISKPIADEVMVNATRRQETRDRQLVWTHLSVRQDDDISAVFDRFNGRRPKLRNCRLQIFARLEGDVQRRRVE